MKIIVTGSLGNVARPLAQELIQNGHSVSIITSDAGKQQAIEDIGARAAVGLLEDADFLKSAFAGADAVFAMIPPNFTATDPVGHYRNITESYARALEGSGVKKVVHLSSWGADLDKDTGFILGSQVAEGILNNVPELSVTHLRAGFIYYNLFHFVEMIKGAGRIASNYGGDDKIAMVSPVDIAAAAAEELTMTGGGNKVRYIISDDRTANEVAKIIGGAIGKPDLQWITLTNEEMKSNMEKHGLPAYIIENTVALNRSIHNGNLRKHYGQTAPHVMGKVKLEDFAREFAAVYHKS